MSLSSISNKICFIAPKAYALFNPEVKHNFGGAEVDLFYLAVEFAKDPAFNITFITADYGGDHKENIHDIRIIKTFDFKQNFLIGAIKFWRGLSEANAQYYIIKTISPGMFITALFCKLKHKSFIYRSAHTYNCDGTYINKHTIYGMLYKWALRIAQEVFVQNETDQKQLLQTTGKSSTVIPNGHPLAPLKKHKRDIVLWVGRSANIKQPELFIELASHFPKERFVMICVQATGDENYSKLSDSARDVKNFEFLEYVELKHIQTFFERSKVFVNTSKAEGFPNTFIQACISSTPVLSLQVNPDNFLSKYNIGICCSKNTTQLPEKLKLMLSNKHLLLSMGKNARKYVKQKHNIKEIVKGYKDLLCM